MPISKKTNKVITDLEIEKRLDKLSETAVYDEQNKKEDKLISDKRPKRIALYLDPAMLDMRDTALEKKLDTISNNSILANGGDIPVQENGIVPYNIVDNYIQEEKTGQRNLLGVSYIPDLEALPQIPFNDIDLDVRSKNNQLRSALVSRYDKLVKLFKKQKEDLYKNDEQYNKAISNVDLSRLSPQDKQNQKISLTSKFETRKQTIQDELQETQNDLIQIEADLEIIRAEENLFDNVRSDYEAEKSTIERRNKEKIRLMEQEFNNLNRGRYSVQQFEGESDDDYKTRMEQLGNTELLQQDADEEQLLYQSKIFKNNLKEIIRQPDIIESVLKKIKEEYDTEGLKDLNQIFPFVKTEFIKTFGKYPVQISVKNIIMFLLNITKTKTTGLNLLKNEPEFIEDIDDYRDFQREFLENIPETPKRGSASEAPLQLSESEFKRLQKNDEISGLKKRNGSKISELTKKLSKVSSGPGRGPRIILTKFIKEYESKYGNGDYTLEDLTKGKKTMSQANVEDLVIYIVLNEYQYMLSEGDKNQLIMSVPDDDEEFEGYGLKKMPKLSKFGKVSIKPHDLFYNNKLAIRDMKGRSLTGFPDVPGVSDGFVDMVMKVSKGEKPSIQDYKNLALNEKPLFDSLIFQSKLHKVIPDIPNGGENTLKELKHRLNLLEGQLSAGNDNDDIKKELHGTVYKLVGMGALNHNTAKNYLQDMIGNLVKPRKSKK